MSTASYRFKVGAFECIAINDFMTTYTASSFFANAPQELLEDVLCERDLKPGQIPSPFTCLFVDTGESKVLVDTGVGQGVHPRVGPYQGKLLQSLHSEGIEAKEIDTVILTHGHPDHIGGNVDQSGKPLFSNARYVMWVDEWDFWMSESTLGTEPPHRVQIARERLLPIKGQLDLVDRETEIVPGICAVDARGHTPGHMAVSVSSGGEELLYVSDTVLHPIHLEHPEWHTDVYDHDLEQAAATKQRIFDRAAADGSLVLAFHFHPFPSLGHVVKREDGWQWQPIEI